MAAPTLGSGGRNDKTEWKGLSAFSKEVGQQDDSQPLTLYTTYGQIFYETQSTLNGPQNLALSLGSQLKGSLEISLEQDSDCIDMGHHANTEPSDTKKRKEIILFCTLSRKF